MTFWGLPLHRHKPGHRAVDIAQLVQTEQPDAEGREVGVAAAFPLLCGDAARRRRVATRAQRRVRCHWQRAVDRSGMQGLRVTRIQHYRDLYERQLKY